MLIAFVGMDGSGKSTFAQETVILLRLHGLNAEYYYPAPYIVLGPIVSFLHRVYKFFEKDKAQPSQSPFGGNPFLNLGKKPLPFRLWPYLALADNLICYFIRIRPLLKRGVYVVCDRYFYDKLIGFEYHGYSDRITSSICLSLIPKPDLTFVLEADPFVACSRERGPTKHNVEFFVELRERYRDLARKFDYQILDTSDDFGGVQKAVMTPLKKGVVSSCWKESVL